MTDTKPERLGAEARGEDFADEYYDNPRMGYEEAKRRVTETVREAEAALREKMECGHPNTCLAQGEPIPREETTRISRGMAIDAGEPNLEGQVECREWQEEQEPYCSACASQAQAVEKARREALEEACKEVETYFVKPINFALRDCLTFRIRRLME